MIVFKLATNTQNDKAFLLTSKVCPQGVVCPCRRAIYIYKIIKNVYKIRFFFFKLQRKGKGIRDFCWHQNFVPKGLYALARGGLHMYKIIKNVYKIRFRIDHFINLQHMGKKKRLFCCHQNFVPIVLFAPATYMWKKKRKKKEKENVYTIRLQRDCFKTCNKWAKW